ncbi:hypothetical protein SRIMM317S_03185 [Streptomyces rimosus subsp. rimosus]
MVLVSEARPDRRTGQQPDRRPGSTFAPARMPRSTPRRTAVRPASRTRRGQRGHRPYAPDPAQLQGQQTAERIRRRCAGLVEAERAERGGQQRDDRVEVVGHARRQRRRGAEAGQVQGDDLVGGGEDVGDRLPRWRRWPMPCSRRAEGPIPCAGRRRWKGGRSGGVTRAKETGAALVGLSGGTTGRDTMAAKSGDHYWAVVISSGDRAGAGWWPGRCSGDVVIARVRASRTLCRTPRPNASLSDRFRDNDPSARWDEGVNNPPEPMSSRNTARS